MSQFDYRRSHHCGALSSAHENTQANLSGWVDRIRDHGHLIFIDLRDRFGITQLVIDPETSPDVYSLAKKIRSEWVVSIKGVVRKRSKEMVNPKIPTGEIEVKIEVLEVHSQAKTPPFPVNEEHIDVNEELRLKYRYLDIRRGIIAKNLALRHKVMLATRKYLDEKDFLEISTPILAKSTPEGARDYLVPSRCYPGNFYALPQSPQIFKQLLMISGMDRYFQIAPCFRDEDLRSDRQPEFTQIDLEMSFGYPEDIMALVEELLTVIFQECAGIGIKTPFPRLAHQHCIENYGTDRPDLRFGMPLVRIDEIAKRSEFSVFLEQLAANGVVKGICVKKIEISRKEIEGYTEFVGKLGLLGLAWMKRQEEGLASSITKFFSSELLKELEEAFSAEEGDTLFMAAGSEEQVNQALDHLRRHIAKERGLIPQDMLAFAWVVDFPLLKFNAEEERLESEHHPFTAPHPDDIALLDKDPLKMRALSYDIVLNGYEIGGGSQRIHKSEVQTKIFELLKLSEEEIQKKFGFFVEALKYGTPPHLGLALGLDRLIMILAGTENIRDVIAFPKTQRASDLMLQCPSPVSFEQLRELKIQAKPEDISWT